MGYSPWGRKELDTTEHAHTLLKKYGRTEGIGSGKTHRFRNHVSEDQNHMQIAKQQCNL